MKRPKCSEEQIVYAIGQADAGTTIPTGPTERWSMDIVYDIRADGRPFRVLTVVDHGTGFQSRALEDWAYRRGVQVGLHSAGKTRGKRRFAISPSHGGVCTTGEDHPSSVG